MKAQTEVAKKGRGREGKGWWVGGLG